MDRTGVDVIRVLFVCLLVCLFVTHHFVWCGGASLAAVDSEPEWLWQVGNLPLYTVGTVAARWRKGRTGHRGESPSWSSCSVLPLSPSLCFLFISSIVPAPAVSAKSEATSWGQLKLIWRFPTWKGGRGGGLERLEAAYLPDVELTARQECKSRRYGRIWCVCPYCQSEVLSGSSRN